MMYFNLLEPAVETEAVQSYINVGIYIFYDLHSNTAQKILNYEPSHH